MAVKEEDIPTQNHQRPQEWTSSKIGSLSCPAFGSSERRAMLEDAQSLENAAETFRKKAEHLWEQAHQKRLICAPIRLLPSETLSRILVLASPASFAFQLTDCGPHPLSAVSRAWYYIIKTAPEFYSRIHIDIPFTFREKEIRDAEQRLPAWLSKAKNTCLNITFKHHTLPPHETSFYSSGPMYAMWTMLLPLACNWEELCFSGPSPLLHLLWQRPVSARKLEAFSIHVTDWMDLDPKGVFSPKLPPCSLKLPRLHRLHLGGTLYPEGYITDHFSSATTSLQELTLEGLVASLSEDGVPGFGATFPFLTKLRLEDVFLGTFEVPNVRWTGFDHLQRFELSQGPYSNGQVADPIPLPALHGCHMLKTLRLRDTSFDIPDKYHLLTSVEHLELELGSGNVESYSQKFNMMFSVLPSLTSLMVSPYSGILGRRSCNAEGVLNALYDPKDRNGLPTCPDLAVLSLRRCRISNSEITCFIADRTFDVPQDTIEFIESTFSGSEVYVKERYRNLGYPKWKPTCLVTTSKCPGKPDMVKAGLEALVDGCKRGELVLNDRHLSGVECDPSCYCECGYLACSCCEHQGRSGGD